MYIGTFALIGPFRTDGQGAVSAGAARNERHTPVWTAVATPALAIIDAIAVANSEGVGGAKPPARERNELRKSIAEPTRSNSLMDRSISISIRWAARG